MTGCARIFGGGAAGVITNEEFGYAGNQVGVACLWMDGSDCDVLSEPGMAVSETDTGVRLGKRLSARGITPESPVMLFYDAVGNAESGTRVLMATWLLEGIREGLGFFPDIMGAGIQGDHVCTPTMQFLGEELGEHQAMALTFSKDIRVDSAIMHGCRPASPYYTVTKAEGPVILEINGQSALSFLDNLLGPDIRPENYPFFLLLGINHGEPWGEFDENKTASRLCLGIDKERGGIVMFEPDMVAGTEFQIMYSSLGMDYMKPKIEGLFQGLGNRKPVFAVYIDCAGRCAGYGGKDLEDALVVQKVVGGRVPLLGLYTGVEIASMGGRPRGLDWTGVFCLFSECGPEDAKKPSVAGEWGISRLSGTKDIPQEALLKLCEADTAKILALDTQSIAIRHELEHKRRGFSLLAELSVSLRGGEDTQDVFWPAARRINAALNMQRTLVLFPDGEGRFTISILQGYPEGEKAELADRLIEVDAELLDPEKPVLVTSTDTKCRLESLRALLKLPYFISAPVIVRGDVAAILITGRMMEAAPFFSVLGRSDVETVQAISALLGSMLVHQQLSDATRRADTDSLTGLFNRRALETRMMEALRPKMPQDNMFAFIMIDLDHFKQINDTYGHMTGDAILVVLAETLRGSFRSTDIMARIGGDEFAVFCPLNGVEKLVERVACLVENWRETPRMAGDHLLHTTLSVGISIAPQHGRTFSDMFRHADIALYRSKRQGRNQYTLYDTETMGES